MVLDGEIGDRPVVLEVQGVSSVTFRCLYLCWRLILVVEAVVFVFVVVVVVFVVVVVGVGAAVVVVVVVVAVFFY